MYGIVESTLNTECLWQVFSWCNARNSWSISGRVLHLHEDDRYVRFCSEQASCSDNESGVHSAVETQVFGAATQLRTSNHAVADAAAAAGSGDVTVNERCLLPVRKSSSMSTPARGEGAFG